MTKISHEGRHRIQPSCSSDWISGNKHTLQPSLEFNWPFFSLLSLYWLWKPDLTCDALSWKRKTGFVCAGVMASVSGLGRQKAFLCSGEGGTDQVEWTCNWDQMLLDWQQKEPTDTGPLCLLQLTPSLISYKSIFSIKHTRHKSGQHSLFIW